MSGELYSSKLDSWMTAATAAIIAVVAFGQPLRGRITSPISWHHGIPIFSPLAVSTIATLLVMSALHRRLVDLCKELTKKEASALIDARTDPLTHLANRKALIEELASISTVWTCGEAYALILIDLNHFKRVNDTHGHAAGDELIVAVANRMRALEEDAFIARLGGDEFALIVKMSLADDLSHRVDIFSRALSGVYELSAAAVFVGISAGAVLLDRPLPPSELLHRADMAMYKSKATGSGSRVFDQTMLNNEKRRTILESSLKDALETGKGLGAALQLIVDNSGRPAGGELFFRCSLNGVHPITAKDSISIAEAGGFIHKIGEFMAHKACTLANAKPDWKVSLNISAVQLIDTKFVENFGEIFEAAGQSPSQFELDIPEDEFVIRGELIRSAVARLKQAGFGIAVDDFGTSTASLVYLSELGVDTVKVDSSLLRSCTKKDRSAFLRAVVALSRSLGMRTLFEGVSNELESRLAIQAGADFIQGKYFGKPVNLDVALNNFDLTYPPQRRRA